MTVTLAIPQFQTWHLVLTYIAISYVIVSGYLRYHREEIRDGSWSGRDLAAISWLFSPFSLPIGALFISLNFIYVKVTGIED